jgi:hypothetical protein
MSMAAATNAVARGISVAVLAWRTFVGSGTLKQKCVTALAALPPLR